MEISAIYKNGLIKPNEKLDLKDGEEISLIIIRKEGTGKDGYDASKASRGGWCGLMDGDKFIKEIYESRLIQTRPEVKL